MLAIQVAALLVLAVGGTTSLLFLVVGPYWGKKFMTEARKREIDAEKAKKHVKNTLEVIWSAASLTIFIGLPALFIIDGLLFRIGLLYSPLLSFFNPFDGYMQIAGAILSSMGLVIMVAAGKILLEHVFAKASQERKMLTTGIYAYIRHPFYLSFILIPAGLLLLTLNYVSLLLLPPSLVSTNGELEELVGKRKFMFLTTSVKYEEQALLKKFGKDYEEYMKRTGRFFPKIRK